jgi:hypothetical protein
MATIREMLTAQTFGEDIFYKTSTSKTKDMGEKIALSWGLGKS